MYSLRRHLILIDRENNEMLQARFQVFHIVDNILTNRVTYIYISYHEENIK